MSGLSQKEIPFLQCLTGVWFLLNSSVSLRGSSSSRMLPASVQGVDVRV